MTQYQPRTDVVETFQEADDSEEPASVYTKEIPGLSVLENMIYCKLEWLLKSPKNGKLIDGERWIFNSYAEWQRMLPWFAERTIRLAFKKLENLGLIEACQPAKSDRRKFYRIKTVNVYGSARSKSSGVCVKICRNMWQNLPHDYKKYYKKSSEKAEAFSSHRSASSRSGLLGENTEQENSSRADEMNPKTRAELEAIVHTQGARSTKSKESKASKARGRAARISGSALLGLWKGAHTQNGEKAPTAHLAKSDEVILKKARDRHVALGDDPIFVEVMEWSVCRWSLIMSTKFKGMTEPPERPSIRFFVKCFARFAEAYTNKQEIESFSRMTLRERMIFERVKKGTAEDVAEREVDEKLGHARDRRDLEARERKLQSLQRIIQQRAEEADRVKIAEHSPKRERSRAVTGAPGTFETWE